jgi:hypothetical protein
MMIDADTNNKQKRGGNPSRAWKERAKKEKKKKKKVDARKEGREGGMDGRSTAGNRQTRRLRTSWRFSSGVRIWGSYCKLHVLTQQRTDFFQPLFSAFFRVTDPSPSSPYQTTKKKSAQVMCKNKFRPPNPVIPLA